MNLVDFQNIIHFSYPYVLLPEAVQQLCRTSGATDLSDEAILPTPRIDLFPLARLLILIILGADSKSSSMVYKKLWAPSVSRLLPSVLTIVLEKLCTESVLGERSFMETWSFAASKLK